MRVAAVLTLISFAMVVGHGETHAQTEPLRFATIHLEPYGFTGGANAQSGIFQKIHAAIATKAGLPFTDSVMPLKRVLKQLLLGASDCGIVIRTPWNADNYDLVAEIRGRFDSVIVTRKGFPIFRAEGLEGHVLALPRGSYVGYPVSQNPGIERYHTNGYAQSARLLKAGRVDAIAGSAISIFYNLDRLGLTRRDVVCS